jgi:hypothetical protein
MTTVYYCPKFIRECAYRELTVINFYIEEFKEELKYAYSISIQDEPSTYVKVNKFIVKTYVRLKIDMMYCENICHCSNQID